jgi:hypothetical protein
MQTYNQAVYLLQNNCTYLNEFYKNRVILAKTSDYCAITEFTPADLSAAVMAVNFESNSGPLSFIRSTIARKTGDFDFYQWGKNGSSKVIASFVNEELIIDYAAIQYPNGQVPISSTHL